MRTRRAIGMQNVTDDSQLDMTKVSTCISLDVILFSHSALKPPVTRSFADIAARSIHLGAYRNPLLPKHHDANRIDQATYTHVTPHCTRGLLTVGIRVSATCKTLYLAVHALPSFSRQYD